MSHARDRAAPLVGATLYLVTAAVNLQVPLYPAYAAAAGFGAGLTAVAFAAYVAGLLPVLLLLGGLSDRVGRKPVLIAGLLCAACATAAMIVAPSIGTLFLARVLQGVGVGLSVGAGTAALATAFGGFAGAARAARLAALTTSLGFGSGALLTSLSLAVGLAAPPVSYAVVLALVVGCLIGVAALMRRGPQGGADAGAGALLRLPDYPRGTVPYGVAIGAAWAVTGLVIAVIPRELARYDLAVWAGPTLFLVNATGAALQPVARRLTAWAALRVGFALLSVGYAALVVGAWLGTLPLVLLGAATAGAACYGFTYLGGLAAVNAAASEATRARAVSGYFLCAYAGLGIPSVAVGFLADRVGAFPAFAAFGGVLLLVNAAVAAAIARRPAPRAG